MRLSVNVLRPRLVLSTENIRYNNSTKIYNNGAIVFTHCKKIYHLTYNGMDYEFLFYVG
jgi:hypothetical protein